MIRKIVGIKKVDDFCGEDDSIMLTILVFKYHAKKLHDDSEWSKVKENANLKLCHEDFRYLPMDSLKAFIDNPLISFLIGKWEDGE